MDSLYYYSLLFIRLEQISRASGQLTDKHKKEQIYLQENFQPVWLKLILLLYIWTQIAEGTKWKTWTKLMRSEFK